MNNPNLISNGYPDLAHSTLVGILNKRDFCVTNLFSAEYLLLYVTKGSFFVEQYGQSFVLHAGDYILLDKRFPHSYHFDPNIPSEFYWMHMAGQQTVDMVSYIARISPLPCIASNPLILDVIREAIALRQGKGNIFTDGANVMRSLYTVLSDMHDQSISQSTLSEENTFHANFEEIIKNSELSSLTLDYICEKMHMNKYYFSHKFKEYYAISPIRYVNMLKLQKAKQYLSSSDLKIVQIAHLCGYSSNSYFANVFRKETGMTPEQYRCHNPL